MTIHDISTSLTILSSMITPAVLMLASGSLILTTSQRLGRIIERVRKISDQFEKLAKSEAAGEEVETERQILFILLSKGAVRAKLLQKALSSLYFALSVFVATSLTIGILAILKSSHTWIPLVLGMSGACMLFYSSVIMIWESRIALSSVDYEMDFVLKISRLHAPKGLITSIKKKRIWRG